MSKAISGSLSPSRPTLMLAPVTQQKSLKMLARSRHHLSHDAAQPDQVARGFMIGVGHPDGGQLSGPMKAGERVISNLSEIVHRAAASALRHRDRDPLPCEHPNRQI